MQIVIDIPIEQYNLIMQSHRRGVASFIDKEAIMYTIKNGTPLPKGHGRLMILSEDAVKREQTPLSFSCQNWISELGLLDATVAIIEADKVERDK